MSIALNDDVLLEIVKCSGPVDEMERYPASDPAFWMWGIHSLADADSDALSVAVVDSISVSVVVAMAMVASAVSHLHTL
ncbi:hypothetical protein FRC16_001988, partial [Serendipita sp. 398]